MNTVCVFRVNHVFEINVYSLTMNARTNARFYILTFCHIHLCQSFNRKIKMNWVLCIFFGLLLYGAMGQEGEKMSFKSPELTDEEQYSSHLPSNLKCDACTAISYQMTEALSKESKKKKGKKLTESQIIDVFDNVCQSGTFESYGLKTVDGVNRISGKGLDTDKVPGMMMGGGKWPGRLMSKCFDIIGDLGEEELYQEYLKEKDLKKLLCTKYSNDCNLDKKTEL